MERILKRILCVAVVLAMVLTLFPGGLPKASAAEADPLADITDWTDWDGTTAFPKSGNYRLTKSVTLEGSYIQIGSSRDVNLDLNGHTITAAAGKQVFRVSGSLSITDLVGGGMITGGQAVNSESINTSDKRGGNIYINSGTFNLYGGTITGGQSVSMGGNIYATGGTVNIAGGTVSSGTSAEGGNIALMHSKLTLSGEGTISGGSATSAGGNIYATGNSGKRCTVTINGGTVADVADDSAGGSIYCTGDAKDGHDTIVIISGGTLQGETYLRNTASCTISGAPVVEKLRLAAGMLITPENLEAGASVAVISNSGTGVISGALKNGQNYLPAIHAYEANRGVGISDNKLVITGGCICGCGTAPDDVVWQPVTYAYLESQSETGALNGDGHYYLAEDLTLTADVDTLEIYGRVTLDLRGKTVTPAEGRRAIYVNKGATLNLMDSVGGSTVTGNATSYDGGTVYVTSGAIFNLYSGTIVGSTLETGKLGGTVFVTGGKFNMYGGKVTGGSASGGGNIYITSSGVVNIAGGTVSGGQAIGSSSSGTHGRGGNIYISKGSVTISGSARVTGGYANYVAGTNGRGGNIFSTENGTLKITDNARVSGGTADKYAGNIMITGATLTLSGNAAVTGGKDLGKHADNIVNMYGDLIIADSAVVDAGAADGCGISIQNTGSANATTGVVNNSTLQISGGTLKGVVTANSYTNSISLSGAPVVKDLRLDGALVTACSLTEGASITVQTTAEDKIVSGTLDNAADSAQYFHAYEEGSTVAAVDSVLKIVTGCVCGCETPEDQVTWKSWSGGAITASGHYRLSGNETITSGVQIAAGLAVTIDLYGRILTASGCRAFLVSGKLNIVDTSTGTAGTITGGTATNLTDSTDLHGRGGNFYLAAGAEVNLYNGNITNGTATSWTVVVTDDNGNAVYDSNGNLKTKCASGLDGLGGNVYICDTAVFNMYGGTISGGVCNNDTTGAATSAVLDANRGGNINTNGTFNMYGGTVSDGSASRGGNICSTKTVNIYDGNVENGAASWGGGNIISTGMTTTVSVYGGNISGGNNHGIYVMYATLRVSGGTIASNIFAANSSQKTCSTVYITGGTITGAITDSNSYEAGGDPAKHVFVISGGTISSINLKGTKTLVISGAPTISSMTLDSEVLVTPVQMASGASVTLSAPGVFTTNFKQAAEWKDYFTSSDGYTVQVINETLAMCQASGTSGNVTWQLTSDGVLYLSGTGAMNTYTSSSSSRAPWYAYRTSITSVVVGEGITSIGNYAFYSHSKITSITIPSSVTSIGSYAFRYTSALTTVNYLGTSEQWAAVSVTSSGNSTFTALTPACEGDTGDSSTVSDMAWTLVDGILTITGTDAMPDYYYGTTYSKFSGAPWADNADQITTVVVNGCTTIGAWAFANLPNLTSVTLDEAVYKICNNAFRNCVSLETINIQWVETIEHNAFQDCTALTKVTGMGILTKVDDFAFYGCTSLEKLENCVELAQVGLRAFEGCSALAEIEVSYYCTFENGLLYDEDGKLIAAPGATGSITVPSGITEIPDYVFTGNTNVTSITLPDSVTAIGGAAFDGCTALQTVTLGTGVATIDINAFANCDSLTAINVASGNSTYASGVDGSLYSKDMTTLVQVPGGLTDSYAVADTVTTVGEGAFAHNANLTNVVLPSAVTAVGKRAFSCAENLATVTIPTGVTAINLGTFECSGLTDVYYQGNAAQWAAVSVASYNEPLTTANIYCTKVAEGTCGDGVTWLVTSDGVLTISGTGAMSDYASYAMPWYAHKAVITAVVVEEGVTSIGASAFAGCAALTDVTIAKSVTTVGSNAFSGTALQTVTYGGSQALWNQMVIGEGNELLTNAAIEVTPAKLVGLQVQTKPSKLNYTNTEELDLTGMELVVFYDDNTTTLITEGYEVSYAFTAPGTQTVTITYGDFSASFDVTVTFTGSCGDNLTWTLTGDGVLTISGAGEMIYYDSKDVVPWWNYKDMVTSLVLDEDMTDTLSRFAFYQCTNLTSVTIPEGIEILGSSAFYGCSKLAEVHLPTSLTTIRGQAFDGCDALAHVYYAGSRTSWSKVTVTGENTDLTSAEFHYARVDLVSIEVKTNPTKQEYCLNEQLDTTGLVLTGTYDDGSTQDITDGFTTSYDFSVAGTQTVTVTYDGKTATFDVTVVPAGTTADGLSWNLADGILTITGTGAMTDYAAENAAPWAAYAEQITALAIGEGVSSIGTYAFYNCTALIAAAIPETVTVIGAYAFDGCTALESALYGGSASQWESVSVGANNDPLLAAVEFATTIVYGDVTGDGDINTFDMLRLLDYLRDDSTVINFNNADVVPGGGINNFDMLRLLDYLRDE